MRRWVFDASPLIALGRAGLLDLSSRLAVVGVVPEAVAREVEAGDPDDPARVWLRSPAAYPVEFAPVARTVAAWDLGAGESEVLSYAIAHPETVAVLDDRPARTCAAALGVRVRGTLGILVLAKREGALPAVRPAVDALLAAGYCLAEPLVAAVLAEAGEAGP